MTMLLPAAAIAALLGATVTAPLLLLQAGPGATPTAQTAPSAAARTDIPPALLPRYQQAPACTGLPWQIIAAIGAIESNHARHSDAHLDPATGNVTPPILGPALNGGRFAAIHVPAGGSPWHTDPVWDHAAGPMQFITSTWAAWGVDASGDGTASPHNAYDAIATTGRYLCNHRTQLDNIHAAIHRYNPDPTYVADVIAKAGTYGLTDGGEPPPDGPITIAPSTGGPVLHGNAARVIQYARAQLGKPYIWGAAGPNAYDCSGLTLAAYATIGIHLPHYAAYQAAYGQPINWHLQPIHPGDLLFLRGGDPIHDNGHVGIALDPHHWINAPQAGDVVSIDPLPYSTLQTVRRLLGP